MTIEASQILSIYHEQVPDIKDAPLVPFGQLTQIPSHYIEQRLSINLCANMPDEIQFWPIIEETARKIYNSTLHPITILGVGPVGLAMKHRFLADTGTFSRLDVISNDGEFFANCSGNVSNDDDFVILTPDPESVREELARTTCKNSDYYKNNTRGLPWAEILPATILKSRWGLPDHIKILYARDGNTDKTINPIDVSFFDIGYSNNPLLEALGMYSPAYSNKIGDPTYVFTYDKNGPRHFIWQPFPAEELNPKHEIELTDPDKFGDGKRSVLQITRVAITAIQASIVTHQKANLSENTINKAVNALDKWGSTLTLDEKASAERRLNTTLHRAMVLRRAVSESNFLIDNISTFYYDPLKDVISFLNELHWGEKVLGKGIANCVPEKPELNFYFSKIIKFFDNQPNIHPKKTVEIVNNSNT